MRKVLLLSLCGAAIVAFLSLQISRRNTDLPTHSSTLDHAISRSPISKFSEDYLHGPPECPERKLKVDDATNFYPALGCETLQIHCDDSARSYTQDMGGFCAAALCELHVPQSLCADFALTTSEASLHDFGLGISAVRNGFAFDQIWDHCRLWHEYQHFRDGPLRPLCHFEYRGSFAQSRCLERYARQVCGISEDETCSRTRRALCRVRAALRIVGCVCDSGTDLGSGCPNCLQQCQEEYTRCFEGKPGYQNAASICEGLESSYCKLTIAPRSSEPSEAN